MAWLRLDDQFLRHPKVAPLSDQDLRVLLATMLYVASFRDTRDSGIVPEIALKEVPNLTRKRVGKYLESGLWDTSDQGLASIHDWHVYNPKDGTAADRAKRYRERKDEAIDRDTVTETSRNRHGESHDPDRDANGPSRAGTRARSRPVPPSSEGVGTGTDRSTPRSEPTPLTADAAAPANGHQPDQETDVASEAEHVDDVTAAYAAAARWLRAGGYLETDWRYRIDYDFGVTDDIQLAGLADLQEQLAATEVEA